MRHLQYLAWALGTISNKLEGNDCKLVLEAAKIICELRSLQESIEKQIAELEADQRLFYPAATLFSNAPLVIIQTEGRAKLKVLREVKARLMQEDAQ